MINQAERITQNRVIKLFKEKLGYVYYGNWESRAGNSNIEEDILRTNLKKRGVSDRLINSSIKELCDVARSSTGSLYERNKVVYAKLRYGVKVRPEVGEHHETVFPIDWKNIENNEFGIAEEVTLDQGEHTRRPDLVLYINGIAIGVIELKRGTVDIGESIRQLISNQKGAFNEWFYSTIQLLLAGNNTQGLKYGTTDTDEKFYLPWKEDENDNIEYKLDKYLKKMCDKERLIDMIYNTVIYDAGVKKLPRPHQYFGLKAAQEFVQRREGGIIWHTQGSGKSLMMVMLAKWIFENIANSRIVVLTDRAELDDQIERVFMDVGESDIAKTTSGKELMSYLTATTPRLISSLIHKFGNNSDNEYEVFLKELQDNPVKTQGEIFVFIDECHRTQGGKLNEVMKTVLKGAVFIGFTGTPLLKVDKKTTMDVFGRYIHTYKFNEAVEDGVVKDLMYEGRDIEQYITSQTKIDQWFEAKTRGLNDFQRKELKKKWGTMQHVLSSKSRMAMIVADIVHDFNTKARLNQQRGNAILVASSIYEACKYYTLFLETELKSKCAIVTSYNPNAKDVSKEDTGADSETDKQFIYNTYKELLKDVSATGNQSKTEAYEDHAKTMFRKEPANMKLLIVVSKLLTGFDAPPCSYIYIDKRMQDHTLFQAICRVNRLDDDTKDYGYIVDYMELFGKVTDAINVYTSELDSEGFTVEEVGIQLKDRLKIAKDRLLTAYETVEAICEAVEYPRTDFNYIRYFCGNTENKEELKGNEYKRMALYKAIVEYIRAFANIKADLELAGFTESETKKYSDKLDDYLAIRELIRIASGETLDLKVYEADMRFLIDTYIRAEDSERISPFEDISLLDLMGEDIGKAIEQLPKGVKSNKEAMAEAMENNVRSKIVEEHLNDPKYFEQMSVLLQELIERRKAETIAYQEYLEEMAALAKDVKRGKDSETPSELDTKGKLAIYHILNNLKKALECDSAIQSAKQDGFRENAQKQNVVKGAIYEIVNTLNMANEDYDPIQTVEEIYKVVDANKEDY